MENLGKDNRKHLQEHILVFQWKALPSTDQPGLHESTNGAPAGFFEDNFPMDMAGTFLGLVFLTHIICFSP